MRYLFILVLLLSSSNFAYADIMEGDGTSNNPYMISTCEELETMDDLGKLDSYFELKNDINCVGADFTPLANEENINPDPETDPVYSIFGGELDGKNHTISNLNIPHSGLLSNAGLFNKIVGATIKNLTISDANIESNTNTNGILSAIVVDSEIENVHASGVVDTTFTSDTFHIKKYNGDSFVETHKKHFNPTFSTAEFEFNNLSGSIVLEIEQTGLTPYAGVDMIKLNACGMDLSAVYATQQNGSVDVLNDIAEKDLNVVIARNNPIKISWNLPIGCSTATLKLNANEYGISVPFKFPTKNNFKYNIDSKILSPKIDGNISEIAGMSPTHKELLFPSTGHPKGFFYTYVSNDQEYVYFSNDITIDNTDDYGKDWIAVNINGKRFKVDDYNSEYGVCSFGLTEKVSYKHQTCEIKIPKNEIENSNELNIVMEYYGTAGAAGTGGLIGYAGNTNILNSSADVSITADDETVGGLIGNSNGSILNKTFSKGTVTMSQSSISGGLIGEMYGTQIYNSYSESNVFSESGTTGALAGKVSDNYTSSDYSVINSYATGNVTGNTNINVEDYGQSVYAAGLIGELSGRIINSFYAGTVSNIGLNSEFIGFLSLGSKDPDSYTYDDPEYLIVNSGLYSNSENSNNLVSLITFEDENAASVYAEDYDFSFVKRDSNISSFYSRNNSIFTDQSPVWDFTTPVWYEWTNTFPKFTRQGGVVTSEREITSRRTSTDLRTRILNLFKNGNVARAGELVEEFKSALEKKNQYVELKNKIFGTTVIVAETKETKDANSESYSFVRDLKFGMSGPDVLALQKLLNKNGFIISDSGVGSIGNETDFFGLKTQAALINYQKSKGITPAVGYFGSITRASLK